MDYIEESLNDKYGVVHKDVQLDIFILDKTKDLGESINLLVFKHNEVQIGLIRNGAMQLDLQDELLPAMIKELRAFSELGELYIWRQGDKLKYRLLNDDETDEELHSYEEEHYMWGTKVEGIVVTEENRGMKYTMPFPAEQIKQPLKYKVKNYYKFDNLGLIQFVDARLVQFLNGFGNFLL